MDILAILNKSSDSLILEDLDFFETELDTGAGYDERYIRQCKVKIASIRKWLEEKTAEEMFQERVQTNTPAEAAISHEKTQVSSPQSIVISMDDLAPKGAEAVIPQLSPVQQVQADLKSLREKSDYKSEFKKYVKNTTIIDADFLDKHYSLFDPWELDAIVSSKQLGESFLEKYFGAINHDKSQDISCFQKVSL